MTTDWPLVTAADAFRNPEQVRCFGEGKGCFYCSRVTGASHAEDCVTVTKVVEMSITLIDGHLELGLLHMDVPHFWNAEQCEHHRNDGCLCASNILNQNCYVNASVRFKEHVPLLERLHNEAGCLCGVIQFGFVAVIDENPRRSR